MSIKYHNNESLEIIPSNQDANRLVKHDIEIFIGIVLKELQNVSAIVLEGSYGRQEGAYLEKMGVLDLVNDLDFLLITTSHIEEKKLRIIKTKFLSMSTIKRVDIAQELSSSLHKLKPTLLNYDRKFGSTIVYGNKKSLDHIPNWTSIRIPIREAEQLLMTRLIGFILLYKHVFSDRQVTHDGDFQLKQQLSKSVIAAYDAFLITEGLYCSSYRNRACMIENQNIFNESEKALIADSFAFKLAPVNGEVFISKEYYFRVKDFFIKYFLYIARRQYKTLGKNLYKFDHHYLWDFRKVSIGLYQFFKNGGSSFKQGMNLNLAQLFFVLSIGKGKEFDMNYREKSLTHIALVSGKDCSSDFPYILVDEILRLRM
jgi:hypothetical protein